MENRRMQIGKLGAGIALLLCVLMFLSQAGMAEERIDLVPLGAESIMANQVMAMAEGVMAQVLEEGGDPTLARYGVWFIDDSLFSLYYFWVPEGMEVPEPDAPEREGSVFVGWAVVTEEDVRDDMAPIFDFTTPITDNLMLMTRYEKLDAADEKEATPSPFDDLSREITEDDLQQMLLEMLGFATAPTEQTAMESEAIPAPLQEILAQSHGPAREVPPVQEAIAPGEAAGQPPKEEQALKPPVVRVTTSYEAGVLMYGKQVTLTAYVEGVPEGADWQIVWQNDRSGDFADVAGGIGRTFTFTATRENTACNWRAVVRYETANQQ